MTIYITTDHYDEITAIFEDSQEGGKPIEILEGTYETKRKMEEALLGHHVDYIDASHYTINPEIITRTIPCSKEKTQMLLRKKRERRCFSIINRGYIWYATLSEKQKQELQEWYQAWLDVTKTLRIPDPPKWLK